jgi:hypothetical protein
MSFIVALTAAVLAGYLLRKLMIRQPSGQPPDASSPRPSTAPDDNPEFLRELGERLRREGEDPPSRR